MFLDIVDLCVSVDNKQILNGLNISIKKGTKNVIMGKNGSGKSTLGLTIMGHPDYKVTRGKILFDGNDITNMPVYERAKLGLFLSFQNPQEIDGISLSHFLRVVNNELNTPKTNNKNREVKENKTQSILEFINKLNANLKDLYLTPEHGNRDINVSFSGGEKKRSELLQLKMLNPKLAILDEIDSGLDVDSVKKTGRYLKSLIKKTGLTTLLICHYLTVPEIIGAENFFVMENGKIVKSGDIEIAKKIILEGY
jgi:Fe-S cluster assembly ATP-binding protein